MVHPGSDHSVRDLQHFLGVCRLVNGQRGVRLGAAGARSWAPCWAASSSGGLNNGLFLLNVSPFWQQVVKGIVILMDVAADKLGSSRDN